MCRAEEKDFGEVVKITTRIWLGLDGCLILVLQNKAFSDRNDVNLL